MIPKLILTLLYLVASLYAADFKQAIDPITLVFPADHASHAGYQTEWWYVTGNVRDESGHEFGYQFTIFRRALDPKSAPERGRTSAWAANDFYMLHLAISDISGNTHATFESLERGAAGIAGATDVSSLLKVRPAYDLWSTPKYEAPVNTTEPIVHVWTKEASFDRYKKGWKIEASSPRIGLNLTLNESEIKLADQMLHGKEGMPKGIGSEKGLSRKGPNPGQASYYYSVPRLTTSGTLTLDGKKYTITSGLSWMDHEFGSNQLSKDQAGWEWFAIQLDNGTDLMLYVLRNKDGSIEPNSSGTWSDAVGCSHYFKVTASMLTPGRIWKSPHTGAEYPVEWSLKINDYDLKLKPAMDDQEFHSEQATKINYYEGAIRVEGTCSGKPVKGSGYLEITGKNLGGRM
ncbi:MAG: lipocalin-like domain-containing protein [Planctomycetota bacterium]